MNPLFKVIKIDHQLRHLEPRNLRKYYQELLQKKKKRKKDPPCI